MCVCVCVWRSVELRKNSFIYSYMYLTASCNVNYYGPKTNLSSYFLLTFIPASTSLNSYYSLMLILFNLHVFIVYHSFHHCE